MSAIVRMRCEYKYIQIEVGVHCDIVAYELNCDIAVSEF